MANTTNFNWETPDDTDLVKDGAAAIRTLGSAIDTSLVDLKGGTTGQILSKATNTDMDFTWITNDVGDITAVNVSSPITGGGTSGAVTISIQDGTTAQKGAVQLENSTSSTSTTTAAVPASVKSAYDLADGAIAKSTLTTAGDIIYRNSTVPTRLALGTAGQVLTVNSGATAPEWKTAAAGGGMTLINTGGTTLTGSSITISSIPGTYKNLQLIVRAYKPSTNGVMQIRFNGDSSGKYWATQNGTGLTPTDTVFNISASQNSANDNGLIMVNIWDYTTTTWKTASIVSITNSSSTDFNILTNTGIYIGTSAISSLTIYPPANFTSGTAYLYGVS